MADETHSFSQGWIKAATGLLALVSLLLSLGCTALSVPAHVTVNPRQHPDPLPESWLAQLATKIEPAGQGESGFLILDTGTQALLQRATLIEAAGRTIDAQYYIWNSDISGLYLAQRLLLAADRGVKVRLLLDDINVSGRDRQIAVLDHHPNIEIRIFNPSGVRSGPGKALAFAANFQRMNQRMHNKTFVADGILGIAGGRNVGDEYFDLHPHMNHRDRDVLAVGPVVTDMSANFVAYWDSPWSYPIARLAPDAVNDKDFAALSAKARLAANDTTFLNALPPQDAEAAYARIQGLLPTLVWAPAELIFDPPVENMQDSADQPKKTAQSLRQYVTTATSEILIESAYFILADAQLEMMASLRERNVRVAVLTNSLASNDLVPNHAGYARWRVAMLEQGIELHELRPDASACEIWITRPLYCERGLVSLHAKSAVFDRKTLYIGSLNVNLRSIYLNGETVLVIHSRELAEQVARDIEIAMAPDNSWEVSLDDRGRLRWESTDEQSTREPATGWWKRFKSGLFSRMPIEKYL